MGQGAYIYFFFLLVYHDYFFIIDIISTLGSRLYHGRGSVRVDTRIHFFYFCKFIIFFWFLLIILSVHYCIKVECNSVYAYIHDFWRVNLCRSF